MNKKALAIALSRLKKPNTANSNLEQYSTDSEVAAEVLWTAYLAKDIKNKVVSDFGCGNGIFGIGALMLGAKKVYFVELDEKLLEVLYSNLGNIGGRYEVFNMDVVKFNKKVDVVIQNPPFGVKKRHADKTFLETGFNISNKIYSFHKIESKNFISKIANDNDFIVERLLQFDLLLKKSMEFHKKNKYIVKVGCWVLKRNRKI